MNVDNYILIYIIKLVKNYYFKKLKYSTIPCIERKRFADKKKVKAFGDGLKILIYFFSKYLDLINR